MSTIVKIMDLNHLKSILDKIQTGVFFTKIKNKIKVYMQIWHIKNKKTYMIWYPANEHTAEYADNTIMRSQIGKAIKKGKLYYEI